MNVLSVRGLCKRYGSFALRDVSFDVAPGSITGFIGRNGAGKTTTLKSLLDFVHPDAGEALFSGRPLSADEFGVKQALANSRMLSSDVSAAFDPNFASAFEKKNAAYLGCGVCFNKYTGGSGKHGSSDANAEFIGALRGIMQANDVTYQFSELGKVDLGGGGTIAYMCAKYCMNVIDCGVPVLSMHAPWEVISKVDLYEAYKCYCAFLKA